MGIQTNSASIKQKYLQALNKLEWQIDQLQNFADACEHPGHEITADEAENLQTLTISIEEAGKAVRLSEYAY